MIELYLSKVTENSETETAGKMYARVSYKQTMDLHDMIVGVLTDFVKCVREMVLNGNTVKVGNLAIFKATVESNGLEVLYDAQSDKVASATMGVLKEGEKTGAAVKTIKLLAQSTGDFTREELKKDVKLSWTDKTKAEIAAAKGDANANPNANPNQGGSSDSGDDNQGGENQGGDNQGGNSGTITPNPGGTDEN